MVQEKQNELVSLQNRLADTLLECIGIEQLKQVLLELADSEIDEQNKEIWIEAFDILTDNKSKNLVEYKGQYIQINSGRMDAYTQQPCDMLTYDYTNEN